MLEARNIICLLLAVSVLRTEDTYGAHQRKHRGNRIIDVNDKIIDIQCNLKCHKSADRECNRKCSSEMIKTPRPGKCPSVRHFDTCIDLCQYDFDCSETQKCCSSSCGLLCQDPVDLDKDPTLPPIPEVIAFKIAKIGKDRVCEATLQTSASSYYSYYMEIRYHVGKVLSVRKLGAWQWQDFNTLATVVDQQNQTKRQQVAFKLKPGRWYQFRVAAVSEKGLRGFTEPSRPFTLSNQTIRADPRPPKSPLDLQVISSRILNDTHMTVKVAWCPGKSDLPIEKYKVKFTEYINGSIYSNDTFIKDATQYETKIFRNCSYYIQVQAISINGKRRLKSGMESKLFNATSPPVQNGKLMCSTHKSSKEIIRNSATSSLEDHSTIPVRNFSNYEVKFRPSRKFGMIVQISGFQKGRLIEICAADYNCENTEYGAIRPKKDVIEFSKLKFGTTYTIRTNDLYGIGKRSENEVNPTSAQFTTPKCENWQRSFPRLQVDC